MKLKYTKSSKYNVADKNEFYVNLLQYLAHDWRKKLKNIKFIDYDTATGFLIVSPGFDFDPSGPTIDDETNIRASCIHDALYKMIRWGVLIPESRKFADVVFDRIAKKDGMWWWRRKYYLFFLRKGAGFAADPDNKKKIYVCGN